MAQNRFIIYALISTKTGELRYVGRSCSGMKRPKLHLRPAVYDRSDLHVHRWVRKETLEGFKPEIIILESVPAMSALKDAEEFYIAYFKALGCDLTNIRVTSQGRDYGYKHSLETRAKMSASNTGKTHDKANLRPWNKRKLVVLGVAYESVSDAARVTGRARRTLYRWLRSNPDKVAYVAT